jgi:hypothetical protein
MSETYAGGGYAEDGEAQARVGGILLMGISFLAACLVLTGLIYATGTSARHNAAVLAADCEPSLFMSGLPCTTQQMVIGQYQAILNPATKQLTADTAAYQANEKRHLVAAEAALIAEVATEKALDSSLSAMAFTPQNRARAVALVTTASSTGNQNVPPAAITFTPQMTVVADALIQADQALTKLTTEQARSTSLTQLQSFNPRAEAAGAAVQTQMELLRKALATPLTASGGG